MLDFPSAPVDGQTYFGSNYVLYRWVADPGVWVCASWPWPLPSR